MKNQTSQLCNSCHENKIFSKEMCASCYSHNYNSLRKKAWRSLSPEDVLQQVGYLKSNEELMQQALKMTSYDSLITARTSMRWRRNNGVSFG